ncbi:MAG: hypothetical protein E7282_07530 [Lachnospiraceae bacterium]|nr:hypothetical protein [Lachnospiraceae bacterium]
MEPLKTKVGVSAGIAAAFILLAGRVSVLAIALCLAYAFLIEENELVRKAAKNGAIIWVIYECVSLVSQFIQYIARFFDSYSYSSFYSVMSKIDNFIELAYLIVVVVFAVIYLFMGLPKAPAPAYNAQYQGQPYQAPQQNAPQQNRTCPTCKTLLAGPGICPNCGTKVD